jgi:hypothetical protein
MSNASKAAKRLAAEKRNADRNTLSDTQQLERIAKRPGNSAKEKARLLARAQKKSIVTPTVIDRHETDWLQQSDEIFVVKKDRAKERRQKEKAKRPGAMDD